MKEAPENDKTLKIFAWTPLRIVHTTLKSLQIHECHNVLLRNDMLSMQTYAFTRSYNLKVLPKLFSASTIITKCVLKNTGFSKSILYIGMTFPVSR